MCTFASKSAQAIFLICLLLGADAAWAAPASLRVAVTPNYVAPLGNYANDQLVGGLVFDMSQAIGDELKIPVQFVLLPRKRLEQAMLGGEADLICYVTPNWLEHSADYHWSYPLFKNETVVVGAASAPVVKTMNDLLGQTLGTVLGYHYPALDKQFAAGTMMREDALDGDLSYKKLFLGRVHYIVVNKIEHDYYVEHTGTSAAFQHGSVPVDEFDLRCALSRKSALSPAEFDNAIKNIIREKLPGKWLTKYR